MSDKKIDAPPARGLSASPRLPEPRKNIKVNLPVRQHIKLHALKLFTETEISSTVEKALDDYFRKMQVESMAIIDHARPLPEPSPAPPARPDEGQVYRPPPFQA